MCLSVFLSSLEITIVSTSLVSIVDSLKGSSQASWIVTSYLLTYTGASKDPGRRAAIVSHKSARVSHHMGQKLRHPRPQTLPHNGNHDIPGRFRGMWCEPNHHSAVSLIQLNCNCWYAGGGLAYWVDHQDRVQGVPGHRWRGDYVPQLCGNSGNGACNQICTVWEYHFPYLRDCISAGAGDWGCYQR